jgi:hypothetical protein
MLQQTVMHRLTKYSQNNVKNKERWYVPLFLKSVPYLYLFLFILEISKLSTISLFRVVVAAKMSVHNYE